MDDPWAFQAVYTTLHDFARPYAVSVDDEDYYIHITTGTHVAQISLFLLTESGYFAGRLIQGSPPKSWHSGQAGDYQIIDLVQTRRN
jgi:transcriptional regulatory protein RtcR